MGNQPFTHAQVNQMLAGGIAMLGNIGVPISRSICPAVDITFRSHRSYGQCCGPRSSKNRTGYQYLIRLSKYTLSNSYKSVMNTIFHELIHTCPDCKGHDRQWRAYAAKVKKAYGYDIRPLDGDKTDEDRRNLEKGYTKRRLIERYVIGCPSYGRTIVRKKKTKLVQRPDRYKCAICNVKLVRRYDLEDKLFGLD